MYRLRLTHVHAVEHGESLCEENVTPVDAGIIVHELHIAHFVIVGVDVAQLHGAVAGLGQTCLYGHDGLHLLRCCGLIVAHELEEGCHQLLIGVAHLHGLLIVVEIVVALAQTETTLTNAHNVHRSVALVCAHAHVEHQGAYALEIE